MTETQRVSMGRIEKLLKMLSKFGVTSYNDGQIKLEINPSLHIPIVDSKQLKQANWNSSDIEFLHSNCD